ncbi:Radical SAM domain protein [Thermodesulfatator indicus DSM 15286]|uniref:Radical SAM domain protein n=1 Tax=Thermodesulfatator indicus (strain DSM 15286 / JCM 11887 / CIR29812) TaxID=667014 RepID=F8ACJ9_THEID|nr:radical SAM protein [Thermodesulfatator indicus]AEH44704.1 Radical SAM domain protein [Thermodesulfatator indicus DSM 15286]
MFNLFKKKLPRLRSAQIEVSTYCQFRCQMCPHHLFYDIWQAKHMDLVLFEKIPLAQFKFVHLQGWGEPLLHPDILKMIDIAARYTKVGLTTNGYFLERILDHVEKLDYLAISIASPDEKKHRNIRKCALKPIIEEVKFIARQKTRPKLVLSTVMMRSTIEELPDLIELAKDCGVDEVIANNLDYIPSTTLAEEAIFWLSPNEKEHFNQIIAQARQKAEKLEIAFEAKPLKAEEVIICAERPHESCLITVTGQISPCVYLHLPTKNEFLPRFFNNQEIKIPKVYFGNLTKNSFTEIWFRKEYRLFREQYLKRERALYSSLLLDFPELPSFCKTCYKAYSL